VDITHLTPLILHKSDENESDRDTSNNATVTSIPSPRRHENAIPRCSIDASSSPSINGPASFPAHKPTYTRSTHQWHQDPQVESSHEFSDVDSLIRLFRGLSLEDENGQDEYRREDKEDNSRVNDWMDTDN
jgi:hypothetical protein